MAIRLGDEARTSPLTPPKETSTSTSGSATAGASFVLPPKDFTPVCTTELGYVAKLKPEWDKRNVKVIGLSVDSSENHEGWSKDIEETQGAKVNFPLISDANKKVSDLYDMIHPNASDTVTVRTVFIVGPDKKVKATTWPAVGGATSTRSCAWSTPPALAGYSVSTPVNWKSGEDVIIMPSVSDEDAKAKFPKGWKAVKPYLRLTPQPNK
jgi:alkyl hydroperoxide reductase subunit AhpC